MHEEYLKLILLSRAILDISPPISRRMRTDGKDRQTARDAGTASDGPSSRRAPERLQTADHSAAPGRAGRTDRGEWSAAASAMARVDRRDSRLCRQRTTVIGRRAARR